MRTSVIAAAAFAVLAWACAPASETTPAPASTPETVAKTTRPTIATLQTHDRKVTILGGSKDGELRVMVRDLDGAIVANNVTVDELSRTDPLLGALLHNAVAQKQAKTDKDEKNDGTYLDATLDLPHRH